MKLIPVFLLFCTALCSISCEEVFIDDLSNETVVLLAPSDQDTSQSSAVTFWWEPMEDAEYFRVQVVSPSFASANQLVFDSLVTSNTLRFALDSGVYQWRVRGINVASETPFSSAHTITVKRNDDLALESVILLSPGNNITTDDTTQTFLWDPVTGADQYLIQISRTSSFTTPDESQTVNSPSTSFDYIFTPETSGVRYYWRVRAINSVNTTQTPFSVREIVIDTSATP